MNNEDHSEPVWKSCPPGELSRLADRLKQRDERLYHVAASRAAIGFVLLIAVGSLVVGFLPRGGISGELTCPECQAQFAAYYRQTNHGEELLSTQAVSAVRAHLDHCENCATRYREKYPGAENNPTRAEPAAAIELLQPVVMRDVDPSRGGRPVEG